MRQKLKFLVQYLRQCKHGDTYAVSLPGVSLSLLSFIVLCALVGTSTRTVNVQTTYRKFHLDCPLLVWAPK